MKIKQILYLCALVSIFVNCNRANEKKDILKTVSGNSKDYSLKYEVIYGERTIKLCLISVYGEKKEANCETLEKKGDGYYLKKKIPKGLSDGKNYNMVLSIIKDTSYSYKSGNNVSSCEIKKINNSLYRSTSELKGMSNFKQIILYDKDYNILRIESFLGNKEFIFKKNP